MPTALITGASRGVGAAIARELSPTYDLLLGGRPSPQLDALATSIDGATTFPVELTDHDEVAAETETISELDVLVHSAGIGGISSVEETDAQVWRAMFEVNVIAVAELTRQLLPALRAAGGHVVIINSGSGLRAKAGWSAYSASKFAVRAFAEALREEEPLLRVTSIFPGRIDTDMQRDLVAMEGGDYDASKFLRPETVARAVRNAIETTADGDPQDVVLRPRPH